MNKIDKCSVECIKQNNGLLSVLITIGCINTITCINVLRWHLYSASQKRLLGFVAWNRNAQSSNVTWSSPSIQGCKVSWSWPLPKCWVWCVVGNCERYYICTRLYSNLCMILTVTIMYTVKLFIKLIYNI